MTKIGNNNSILSEVDKLDRVQPSGLTGAENSIAYYAAKINGHLHNQERWLCKAAIPSGETHVADSINTGSVAFQIDGGNNTWGAWTQIIGSSDTPVQPGRVKFDLHRLLITAWERSDCIYKIQIAFGATAEAAFSSGDYTDIPLITLTGVANMAPLDLMTIGVNSGTKVWARCWAVGQNTGTIDFYAGLHEYIG